MIDHFEVPLRAFWFHFTALEETSERTELG